MPETKIKCPRCKNIFIPDKNIFTSPADISKEDLQKQELRNVDKSRKIWEYQKNSKKTFKRSSNRYSESLKIYLL